VGAFSLFGIFFAGMILLLIALRLVIPAIIGLAAWWILDLSGSSYSVELGILTAILVFIAGIIAAAIFDKK
jgi:uncharacterized membrane protein (DUF485 family)